MNAILVKIHDLPLSAETLAEFGPNELCWDIPPEFDELDFDARHEALFDTSF